MRGHRGRAAGAVDGRMLWSGAVLAVLVGGVLAAGVLPPAGAADTGPPTVLPEMPVTAMHQSVGPANNTPDLATDPTAAEFVVMANRLDAPDFSCALQVSGDRGRTWLPANPVPELPQGAEKCYAPEVAFDGDGTLYYLFVGLAGGGNEPMGVFLTTSDDRARTFSEPRQILGPRNYAVRMAVDPTVGAQGRLHLVWIQATSDPPLGGFGPPPNPVVAAFSDDGGRTFSDPVQVSDPSRQRVVAPALALGSDGAVHVAYYDLKDDAVDYQGLEGPTWPGTWSLVVATSRDGGRSFPPGVVVDDAIQPHERVLLIFTMPPPALTASGDGRLCAAWTDARHGDADALGRCSPDGGRTWGRLVRLNDDPMANGATQYQPQLAFAPTGRLDAVFYDRRNDPDDVSNDVFYTFSTDGGRTFAPNRRLTSEPSYTGFGQVYTIPSAQGRAEFGSRMGLLSREHRAVAAWTDTRNSRQGTGQDLFATTVTFPTPAVPGGWWRLGGGALLLGGLAAAGAAWRRRSTRLGETAAPQPERVGAE